MALIPASTAELRTLVAGLTSTFLVSDMLPEIQSSLDLLLPRFLGDTLLQQLDGIAAGETDRKLKQARYLAQVALCRISLAEYLPFGETQIGRDGITISADANRKAAFEYQTRALKKSLLDTGWKALDELIRLAADNATLFPGWSDSPYAGDYAEAIFKSPADFSKYYPIQERWLTFWALRPFIEQVEQEMGQANLSRIDALNPPASADQKKLLVRKLKWALAYQSVLHALPALSIELNGVNVQVNYASQFQNIAASNAPGKDQLGWVMDNLQRQLDLYWSNFNAAIDALSSVSTTDSGAGLIVGNGAITML